MAINACNSQAATDKSPWLNTSLPIPERVDLLVAQMTLEEMIAQMMHQAPAIPRLGIPEYNWWSEGLHGVARGQPGMKVKTSSGILQTSVTIMK